jgi:hypothetical protein
VYGGCGKGSWRAVWVIVGFSKDEPDSVFVRNALLFLGVPLFYEQVI